MILVLADDITGAAEIAGIAKAHGRKTILSVKGIPGNLDGDSVVVVATDIRSGNRDEARKETERLCQSIKNLSAEFRRSLVIYKKTDSVLRGHISTELSVIMKSLGFKNTLLVAQNPSKGRVIRNGEYFVSGTPLNETMFSLDPEFPAFTSRATELVGKDSCRTLNVDGSIDENLVGIIYVADATSKDNLHAQAVKMREDTLAAGGADFFEALLDSNDSLECGCGSAKDIDNFGSCANGKILVVCGSTQTKSISDTPLMQRKKATERCIPEDVFEGASPDVWISDLCNVYASVESFILRVGDHKVKGAEYARRIRCVMACAVERMIKETAPDRLIIEGGATAFSVLSALGWGEFEVSREYSPGVVGMIHGNTEVVLKPGSYQWGNLFK